MPKKTKKQKIKADTRRQKVIKQSLSYKFVKSPDETGASSASSQAEVKEKVKEKAFVTAQNDIVALEKKHLKRDLLKISLFTIFALIFQGMLYYLVYRP